MKYLILGSSGQIGTALTQWCDKNEITYEGFDIARAQEEDLRVEQNPRPLEALSNTDFIMFLAYDVGGSRYLSGKQNQLEFISNNARLMEYTFKAIHDSGNHLFHFFPNGQPVILAIRSTKGCREHYTGTRGIIVKLWNVYGVETDMEKSHVITDFIHKAKDTRCIDYDGTNLANFCMPKIVAAASDFG